MKKSIIDTMSKKDNSTREKAFRNWKNAEKEERRIFNNRNIYPITELISRVVT